MCAFNFACWPNIYAEKLKGNVYYIEIMFSYYNEVFTKSYFIFAFCYFFTGSALMSIVGVYKEIQDQHMNIVSMMRWKKREINGYEFDRDDHSLSFSLCLWYLQLKAFYVDLLVPLETNLERDTKVVQVKFFFLVSFDLLFIYYHILTNKLLQINFKQLCLISSGLFTCVCQKLIELFSVSLFLQIFFVLAYSECAYSCDPTSLNQNHPTITTSNTCVAATTTLAAGYKLHRSRCFSRSSCVSVCRSFAKQNPLCLCGVLFSGKSDSPTTSATTTTITTMCHISSSKGNFCNNIKYELTATAKQRLLWKSNERRKIMPKIQIRRSK